MPGPCIHSFLTLVGRISVAEDGDGNLIGLYLPSQNLPSMEESETDTLSEAAGQINEYLSGRRKMFELPLSYSGTEFFMDIMDAMRRIPYGETRTYAELAEDSGHPGAFRAAGTACGRNPLPMIVPCHRIVPSSGGVGSYGGGSSLKRRLLELEDPDRSLRAELADQPFYLVGIGIADAGASALEPRPSALLAFLLETGRSDGDQLPVSDAVMLQEHLEHVVGNAEDGLVERTRQERRLLHEAPLLLGLPVSFLIGHDIGVVHDLIVPGNESVLRRDHAERDVAELAPLVVDGRIEALDQVLDLGHPASERLERRSKTVPDLEHGGIVGHDEDPLPHPHLGHDSGAFHVRASWNPDGRLSSSCLRRRPCRAPWDSWACRPSRTWGTAPILLSL